MGNGDFRDLPRSLIKYCVIKHLILLKIRNMMDIKEVFLQWFINFLIKKLLVVLLKVKLCQANNMVKSYINQLLENLKHDICGAGLADMKLISKFNKGIRFLLCVINICSKSVWIIHLKDKKGLTSANVFQKFSDPPNRKPNKIKV